MDKKLVEHYSKYVRNHFWDILKYIAETEEEIEFINRKLNKVFIIKIKDSASNQADGLSEY